MRLAGAHLPAAAPPLDEQPPLAPQKVGATAQVVAIPRPYLRYPPALA
jgi:hypothetical protein